MAEPTFPTELPSGDTQRSFLRACRELFLASYGPASLRSAVRQTHRRRIPLPSPPGWFLRVDAHCEGEPDLADRDLRALAPGQSWMVAVGACYYQPPGRRHRRTPCYVLLGPRTRCFVYDAESDALFLAARDVDELARTGFVGVECLHVQRRTPWQTRRPEHLIRGLLWKGNDPGELARFAREYAGEEIALRTPGKVEANPLRLLGDFELVRRVWPFSALSADRLAAVKRYVDRRLRCAWHALGVVGVYHRHGAFHALHLIVVDRFGAVYYFSVQTASLWILADDVRALFRLGLLKALVPGRRSDRDLGGLERLEPPLDTRLWTTPRPAASFLCIDVAGESDPGAQYAWCTRARRFWPDGTDTDTALRRARAEREGDDADGLLRAPSARVPLPVPGGAVAVIPGRSLSEALAADDDAWRPRSMTGVGWEGGRSEDDDEDSRDAPAFLGDRAAPDEHPGHATAPTSLSRSEVFADRRRASAETHVRPLLPNAPREASLTARCRTCVRSGRESRPPGEPELRPRWRYAIEDAVRAVLRDFREIYVHQRDHAFVSDLVRSRADSLLSLGVPSHWFLALRPEERISGFTCHPDWSRFPGCPEGRYVLLGQCVRRTPTGERADTPCLIYLGPDGQLMCYHPPLDSVFLVAMDVDELARRGLMQFEPLYLDDQTPLTTTAPASLVDELLENEGDGALLSELARHHYFRVIHLHTPGETERALLLCGSAKALRLSCWPASGLTDAEFDDLQTFVSERLRQWYYFGFVGAHLQAGTFYAQAVIIVDASGALFYLRWEPRNAPPRLFRLADRLSVFFRMGLTKAFLPGRRLEPRDRTEERWEANGCAHARERAWDDYYDVFPSAYVERDFDRCWRWLAREDRFGDVTRTWDETDPATLPRSDAARADAERRRLDETVLSEERRILLYEKIRDLMISEELAG